MINLYVIRFSSSSAYLASEYALQSFSDRFRREMTL